MIIINILAIFILELGLTGIILFAEVSGRGILFIK